MQQKGQALVMVLLSIGVIITIALSVVSKSVNQVSTTTKDEESLRAFSAAEAGVETILKNQTSAITINTTPPPSQLVGTQARYTTIANTFPENPRSYIYPSELLSGDTATIWLSSHDANNNLVNPSYTANTINLCWGKTQTQGQTQPALSISVLYDQAGVLKYAYTAFDPTQSRTTGPNGNQFTSSPQVSSNIGSPNGTCNISGTPLAHSATLNFGALGIPAGSVLKALTVMSIYNDSGTLFGVNTTQNQDLPVQGRKIESSGVSGESTRKVQVYSLYPEIPTMFQNAIFSPVGLVK